jgi:perosamine synthetase
MNRDIKANLVSVSATIKDVLTVLNRGVFGVVFLVDDEGVMQGLFTDGDVRRALLKGAVLSDGAEGFMNRDFVAGRHTNSRQENVHLLTETVRHLPILDEKGRPVDMISWAEIWRLPVMEPSLGGNELKYVSDCIASNWISSQGEYIGRFERIFQDYLSVDFTLSTTNGTAALHLALAGLGVGPGDEVIVPDLTFGASANAVLHCGAVPIFVDVERDTWTMAPREIEAKITERTKAVMPVHLYGHPCDMDPVIEIARRHDLFIVEDCAEALGAQYKGQKVGTLGDVGCFSFFANKIITTGEGGMITTNDPTLLERMACLRDHGMSKDVRYWHDYAGFNYRMTNLQAAVGLAQMERIEDFLEYRLSVVERYNQQLSGIEGVILPPSAHWAKNVYWLYSIVLDEQKSGADRESVAAGLADRGIETRPFFHPLHGQPPYQSDNLNLYPVTDWLAPRGLSLPTANDIPLDEVDRVCRAIERIISNARLIQQHMAAR